MSSEQLVSLATLVGAKLKARGALLATAESCTGGWVAQAATAIAGSSDWFERGFVSYSNAAKQEMLGVSAATLATHGAVSEQTAREMAIGALAHSRAQVALAITGIAGPTGGSPEKPVGTVCFAWLEKDGAPVALTRHIDGDRESVRRQSVIVALQGVLDLLDA
ncbi:MAG: nicotinamide-nucleotide amidase [Pseudomonadota bacterium]